MDARGSYYFICIMLLMAFHSSAVSANYCCFVNESRLWSRRVHNLKQYAEDAMQPLLQYKFYLPELHLKDAMGHIGSSVRLRKFAKDLMTGTRPLKVGTVGGSITTGEGASVEGKTDWWSVFAAWLGSVSKANITFTNGAVRGTPSAYMSMCLDLALTPDMDLVILEYAWNDGFDDRIIQNTPVKDMERLIRRILSWPTQPAVMLMQVAIVGDHMETEPFYHTIEDVDGALAAYYDATYLSNRNALYWLAAHMQSPGYTWNETFINHHPGDAGHKIMADLAVHAIQEAALSLWLSPVTPYEESVLAAPMIRPMYPNNEIPTGVVCSAGDGFKRLVTSAEGWKWKNEGSDKKPKWGYVSHEPGSKLVLRVNTLRPLVDPAARIPVLIHYLASYEFMGTAQLSCVSGCTCDPAEVDGMISRRVSQTLFAQIRASQSEKCDVAVTLLEKTTSKGHHFKVSGVVVSDTSDINAIFFREQQVVTDNVDPRAVDLLG